MEFKIIYLIIKYSLKFIDIGEPISFFLVTNWYKTSEGNVSWLYFLACLVVLWFLFGDRFVSDVPFLSLDMWSHLSVSFP